MSPRPYQLGKRQTQVDESRRRIVDAARALLGDATPYAAFTVDAVARRADVARATVYYQFGSKTGLLEALCDALAEAGAMDQIAAAFSRPDPTAALEGFVEAFARFWAADRLVMRRLRALAPLDPDIAAVILARDDRRRHGLEAIVGRLGARDPDRLVRVLHMLTSFETFDTLAREADSSDDVTAIVLQLVGCVVRTSPPASTTWS